eukprot:gene3060-6311_t
MPVVLLNHVEVEKGQRVEKGLVQGLRGVLTRIHFDGGPPTEPNADGEYVCQQVPVAVDVLFHGDDEPVTIGRQWTEWGLNSDGVSAQVRSLQLPIGPDFALTTHNAQGTTEPELLGDVVVPKCADKTAGYIIISRVRKAEDLYLLRDFDASMLRRSASKANADILLQRLRGDLGEHEEASKQCLGCKQVKRRSEFIPTEGRHAGSTAQWNGRNRRCLKCMAPARRKGAEVTCTDCGRSKPQHAFSSRHMDGPSRKEKAVCKACIARERQRRDRGDRARARGAVVCEECSEEKPADEFSQH